MFDPIVLPALSEADPEFLRQIGLVILDFDGVLTDNGVWISEDGREAVRCNRSDGLGLARLRSLGVPAVIVSTEVNPVVSMRAKKLKTPCFQAVEDKRTCVLALCDDLGVAPGRTAYVGNDINDIPAFSEVGLAIATADAFPEAMSFAHYVTRTGGGLGAVREVCDLIYWAHGGAASANANASKA